MLKDPVCGNRINRHRAQATIEYKGWIYYVCCPLCQTEFNRDPERYAQTEMGEKAASPREKHLRR